MATSNTGITFKGSPATLTGTAVVVGKPLPQFKVTANDMSDLTNEKFAGKVLIISVVPSIDTPICDLQTKHFNHDAAAMGDAAAVLTVSRDLPFAQKRWCAAAEATNVITASDYRYRTFGEAFGVLLDNLQLLARAVVVADKSGVVQYVEYVDEVTTEPNYEAALTAAKALL